MSEVEIASVDCTYNIKTAIFYMQTLIHERQFLFIIGLLNGNFCL